MTKRRLTKYVMTETEAWRIQLLAEYGFHYKTIARRLWGRGMGSYQVSSAELRRIGKVLKEAGLKTRDWRDGATQLSKSVLVSCMAKDEPKKRKTRKKVA